jgi:hypothetical protein
MFLLRVCMGQLDCELCAVWGCRTHGVNLVVGGHICVDCIPKFRKYTGRGEVPGTLVLARSNVMPAMA